MVYQLLCIFVPLTKVSNDIEDFKGFCWAKDNRSPERQPAEHLDDIGNFGDRHEHAKQLIDHR